MPSTPSPLPSTTSAPAGLVPPSPLHSVRPNSSPLPSPHFQHSHNLPLGLSYTDPNKPLPSERRWRLFFRRLRKEKKLPKPTVPLTERNLNEFGNPEFRAEHEVFTGTDIWGEREAKKRNGVEKWLGALPE